MSDISDLFEKTLRNVAEVSEGEDPVVMSPEQFSKDIKGLAGMRNYCQKRTVKHIRRSVRDHAGSSLGQNHDEIFIKIREELEAQLVQVCMEIFVDATIVGQGKLPAVKRFAFFDRMDEVFSDDNFRAESEAQQLILSTDYELNEQIERYFRGALEFISCASGYTQGAVPPEKVWDVFAMTTISAAIGVYFAGYRIGQGWREQEILAGIAAASEDEEDSDGRE